MFQLHMHRLAVGLSLCATLVASAQKSDPAETSSAATKTNRAASVKPKHDKTASKKAATTEAAAPPDTEESAAHKGGDEKNRTIYAFGLPTQDGKNLPLSTYKGKVLLIVNLGRQSSYAAQITALEKLSDRFKDQGLVVLGVPSNDFGNAEPGTPAEIAKYYADAKMNFPVMQVSSLTGVHELPVFEYLSKNKAVENDGLHWNFTKFLVDRNGKVIVCFPPEVAPDSLAMTATVQEVLDGTWKPKKAEGHDKPAEEDDGDDE